MNSKLQIRPYNHLDKSIVLNLFDLNTPHYFAVEERNDLVSFLEKEIELYFVALLDNQIVGCGGINFSEDQSNGIISWDLLHPDFQRKGIGSQLLQYRLSVLKTYKSIEKITVRTSQHVFPFYEKAGFRLIEITKDYWADGFDLVHMEYSRLLNVS